MSALFLVLCVAHFLAALVCPVSAQAPYGAVYSLSNDYVNGNAVLVSSLSSSGQLSFVRSVQSGGLGSNNSPVSDALFSSHAVQVDRTRNLLFAVNAGSNSVSLFTIDRADPTSVTLVDTQPSGYEYPVAIGLNTAKSLACVANGGVSNGIRCYSYSAAGLVVIPSWDRNTNVPNVTTPITPLAGTSDIAFTPDGNSIVLASHAGHGLVYMFPVDYATNSLAATANVFTPLGSVLPFSLTFFGSDSLLISDPGVGGASFLHYNSATGTSSDASMEPAFNVSGPGVNVGAICWSVYSAVTGSYYLIGATGNGSALAPNTTIAEIRVDPVSLQANVVALHPAVPGVDSQDAVVISLNPTTDILLVLGPIGQVISAYNIPAAGVLTAYETSHFGGLPTGLRAEQGLDYALSASSVAGAAYTMSNQLAGNSIVVSSISSTGAVSYVSTVPTGHLGSASSAGGVGALGSLYSQNSIVVDAARGLLFAVNSGDDTLSMFQIDSSSPTLITSVTAQPTGFQFPVSVALATNLSLACVLNGGPSNGIRCFRYSATSLTVLSSMDTNTQLSNIVLATPNSPFNTTGDLAFTTDLQALVITVRSDGADAGSLLFFPIDYSTMTIGAAVESVLPNSILPFSISAVAADAVLVTEPELGSVSVISYNSSSGLTNAATATPFAIPVASGFGALCWSQYSPSTNSYLLIGAGENGTVIQVRVDSQTLETTYVGLARTTPFAEALDNAIATVDGQDYLLVIGPGTQVIQTFELQQDSIVPQSVVPLPGLSAAMVGLAVYVSVSAVTVPPPTSVLGDPQFVGFHAQAFQVHGIPGRYFNLLTTLTLQLNALFTMLVDGQSMTAGQMQAERVISQLQSLKGGPSHPLPLTTAYSHEGTFLAEMGLKFTAADGATVQVRAVAGAYTTGFATVTVNGIDVAVGAEAVQVAAGMLVTFTTPSLLTIDTPVLSFTLVNADRFFNIEQATLNTPYTGDSQMDGLLGQTANPAWTVERHSAEFREHQLMDFLIAEHDIFSSDFAASLYRDNNRLGGAQ